jgi:hypothetical protein
LGAGQVAMRRRSESVDPVRSVPIGHAPRLPIGHSLRLPIGEVHARPIGRPTDDGAPIARGVALSSPRGALLGGANRMLHGSFSASGIRETATTGVVDRGVARALLERTEQVQRPFVVIRKCVKSKETKAPMGTRRCPGADAPQVRSDSNARHAARAIGIQSDAYCALKRIPCSESESESESEIKRIAVATRRPTEVCLDGFGTVLRSLPDDREALQVHRARRRPRARQERAGWTHHRAPRAPCGVAPGKRRAFREGATFMIDADGALRLPPQRSEHVVCAASLESRTTARA